MKGWIGIILIFAGIVLGFYVGGYLCFYKSVVALLTVLKTSDWTVGAMAWAIVKLFFASAIGGLSALIPITIGMSLAR